MIELAKVTRFEIIDHTEGGNGRVYVKQADNLKVETDMQDNDRTLKIFITDTKAPIPVNRKETKLLYAYSLLREAIGDEPTERQQQILDDLARAIKK